MDSLELIQKRLRSAWDKNRYEALFRKVARFNGCDAENAPIRYEGAIPVWPKLRQNIVKLGEAMDSIYAMESILAKLRSRDIRPDFIDLESEIVREARTEWWMTRCRGWRNIPGWTDVHDQFTMWGIGFGAGVIEVGKRIDEATGRTYVDHQLIEGFNYLHDPLALSARLAKFGAAVCYYDEEEFKEMYPGFKDYTLVQIEGIDKDMAYATHAVRVIRYYSQSTFCVIHHDLDGVEIERKQNPYGRIPFAILTHLDLPGAQFGIGKVDLMQPLQETRNRVRRHYQKRLDSPSFNVMSQGVLSDDAIHDLNDPKSDRKEFYQSERPLNKDEVGIIPVRPPELDPGIERLMQEAERAFNPAGGTTDFALGRGDANADTATEAELIAEQSAGQTSLIEASYGSAMEDLIQLTFHIAKEIDDLPVNVSVKGTLLPLNQDDEDLTCETLFEQDSQVILSQEGMYAADADRKKRKRVESLLRLRALAMEEGIPPTAITEEIFELEGFDFTKLQQAAMQSQAAPQAPGMGMGMMPPDQPEQMPISA